MTNEDVNTESRHCNYYTGYGENINPLLNDRRLIHGFTVQCISNATSHQFLISYLDLTPDIQRFYEFYTRILLVYTRAMAVTVMF